MKRLVILALLAFAGWYGWKHYDQLLHPMPKHQAVIKNDTGTKLVRVRLTVGGHTYVKEEIANGESAAIPFTVDSDSPFELTWEFESNTQTGHWTGGLVTKGPLIAKHIMTIQDNGGVVMTAENL